MQANPTPPTVRPPLGPRISPEHGPRRTGLSRPDYLHEANRSHRQLRRADVRSICSNAMDHRKAHV